MLISKTKNGELAAIKRTLVDFGYDSMTPLFDLTTVSDDDIKRGSSKLTHVNSLVDKMLDSLNIDVNKNNDLFDSGKGRCCFVDNNFWGYDDLLENNVHPLEYVVRKMSEYDVMAIPVIGYERWNPDEAKLYIKSLKNIRFDGVEEFCLRVQSDDVEYASLFPDEFITHIESILDGLNISSENLSILFDLGYVGNSSIEDMFKWIRGVLSSLASFSASFSSIIVGGGGVPLFVSDVVDKDDSKMLPRKEIFIWNKLVSEFPRGSIRFADYGVRHPEEVGDIPCEHTNGKIYYTINEQYYVVRGSSLKGKKGLARASEFKALAERILSSGYLLQTSTNWADREIVKSIYLPSAYFTGWINISTYRHVTVVLQEIREHLATVKHLERNSSFREKFDVDTRK